MRDLTAPFESLPPPSPVAWRVSVRDNPSVFAVVRKQFAFEAYLAVRAQLGVCSFSEVDCEIVEEMTVAPVERRRLE